MSEPSAYSLDELVAAVNDWCAERNLTPANGQSAEQISPRTLRYYRTIGLLSAPISGGGSGYGEIHLLQLLGIRLLQAHGYPLSRIQQLLYGRSMADLRKLVNERSINPPRQTAWPQMAASEDWRVTPIDNSIWLIVRHSRNLTLEQLERIRAIIDATPLEESLQPETKK